MSDSIDNQLENLKRLGGAGFVREMIDLFITHGTKQVEAARQASASGDWKTIERTAHSLKSSAGNIGAVELAQLCAHIE
ncbi:MAG: Hpt domain-containing protein [Gemmataceae bacterium]